MKKQISENKRWFKETMLGDFPFLAFLLFSIMLLIAAINNFEHFSKYICLFICSLPLLACVAAVKTAWRIDDQKRRGDFYRE